MRGKKMNQIKAHFFKYRMGYSLGIGMVLWFLFLLLMATIGQKPPFDSVAIEVGGFSIAWYAVFIISGIVFASILGFYEIKFIGINKDDLYDGILFTVPLAIIGARLYYVIFDPHNNYTSIAEVFDIAGGGLAIHGAVITTILFLIFFTRYKQMNLWKVLDILAPGFLIGQIMGRWGNFFNQEAHGGETTRTFLKDTLHLPEFIVENMNKGGVYYHPTFLYEGLWNLLGLTIILVLRRKKVFKIGDLIGVYLIWYGLGRGFLIEPFRTDPLWIGKPVEGAAFSLFKVNILMSLLLFVGGGVVYLVLKNLVFFKELPYYIDVYNDGKKELEANK